jgi:hypothetical protein
MIGIQSYLPCRLLYLNPLSDIDGNRVPHLLLQRFIFPIRPVCEDSNVDYAIVIYNYLSPLYLPDQDQYRLRLSQLKPVCRLKTDRADHQVHIYIGSVRFLHLVPGPGLVI